MAEPKTEIDRRFDRHEAAISQLVYLLVEKHTGFSEEEAEEIEKILRGNESKEEENASP